MLVTIIGKRGKGKTTLAKTLLSQSQADKVFVFDYLGEYSELRSKRVLIHREDLRGFCQMAWDTSGLPETALIVFDEIDLYGKNNPYISFLYKFGRHKGIEIIGVSRRFYDLPVIVRALTDEFYLFQITEERDINYLRRYIKEEFVQRLIALKNFQYMIITF